MKILEDSTPTPTPTPTPVTEETKISELPDSSTISRDNFFVVISNSTNKVTSKNIFDYLIKEIKDSYSLIINKTSIKSDDKNLILEPQPGGYLATKEGEKGQDATDWQRDGEGAVGNYSFVGGGSFNKSFGVHSSVSGGNENEALEEFTSVSGGRKNKSMGKASNVSGGVDNTAMGEYASVSGGLGNTSIGDYSFVGGGNANTTIGIFSFIGCGKQNTTIGISSIIGAGSTNTTIGISSIIGAGSTNTTIGSSSIVGSGTTNTASGGSSIVGAGSTNTTIGSSSAIGAGNNNIASGGSSIVGAGTTNTASGGSSIVGAGTTNTAVSSSIVGAGTTNRSIGASSIGAGTKNISSGSSSIGAGEENNAAGCGSVGAGMRNGAGSCASVGAGTENKAIGGNSSIGAGNKNTALTGSSVIGGGDYNTTIAKNFNVVPGGLRAKSDHYSELSHASGAFTHAGDTQHMILVGRKKTLNDGYEVVSLDGQDGDHFWMPLNTTWTYTIKVSAYAVGRDLCVEPPRYDAPRYPVLKGAGWIFEGAIRRDNGDGPTPAPGVEILPVKNTVYLNGVLTTIDRYWKDPEMNSTDVIVTERTSEKPGLDILVKGLPDTLVRWTAVVDICQVTWKPPYDICPLPVADECPCDCCHVRGHEIGIIFGSPNEDSNHW